jgi:hypothetical protein
MKLRQTKRPQRRLWGRPWTWNAVGVSRHGLITRQAHHRSPVLDIPAIMPRCRSQRHTPDLPRPEKTAPALDGTEAVYAALGQRDSLAAAHECLGVATCSRFLVACFESAKWPISGHGSTELRMAEQGQESASPAMKRRMDLRPSPGRLSWRPLSINHRSGRTISRTLAGTGRTTRRNDYFGWRSKFKVKAAVWLK